MPSPFPGMDPYLESSHLWPDVHHGLISEMQAQLNRHLRPKYHVRVEERVYISDETDPGRKHIIPDLRIAANDRAVSIEFTTPIESGSTAVAEPVVLTTLIDDEIHEARLEIIDTQEKAVVTVIEILSPTNKVAGSRGRRSYEEKRREVMTSSSHFVEIDLLRDGDHLHCRELLPRADYYIHVSHREKRPKGYVCPILLTQQLPVIGIPLMPEDPDVELNLQDVLNSAYDRAAYDLEVDYQKDPLPSLSDAGSVWINQVLKDKGLRKSV